VSATVTDLGSGRSTQSFPIDRTVTKLVKDRRTGLRHSLISRILSSTRDHSRTKSERRRHDYSEPNRSGSSQRCSDLGGSGTAFGDAPGHAVPTATTRQEAGGERELQLCRRIPLSMDSMGHEFTVQGTGGEPERWWAPAVPWNSGNRTACPPRCVPPVHNFRHTSSGLDHRCGRPLAIRRHVSGYGSLGARGGVRSIRASPGRQRHVVKGMDFSVGLSTPRTNCFSE